MTKYQNRSSSKSGSKKRKTHVKCRSIVKTKREVLAECKKLYVDIGADIALIMAYNIVLLSLHNHLNIGLLINGLHILGNSEIASTYNEEATQSIKRFLSCSSDQKRTTRSLSNQGSYDILLEKIELLKTNLTKYVKYVIRSRNLKINKAKKLLNQNNMVIPRYLVLIDEFINKSSSIDTSDVELSKQIHEEIVSMKILKEIGIKFKKEFINHGNSFKQLHICYRSNLSSFVCMIFKNILRSNN